TQPHVHGSRRAGGRSASSGRHLHRDRGRRPLRRHVLRHERHALVRRQRLPDRLRSTSEPTAEPGLHGERRTSMSRELTALGQRYYGVYLGTVIAVDDEDGLGRVRIENDQYEDTDDDPTWAAVVRPLAGDVTSVYFSPKPGDQVVFTFVAGDVRQPIVLGY